MNIPENLLYTKEHEWLRLEGQMAVVGITDFAQSQLGDIVFVDLPKVGRTLKANETFGVVESVKTVSDLFCPVDGKVIAVHEALLQNPEKVNQDPYQAWMMRLEVTRPDQVKELLNAQAYRDLLESQ